MVSSQSEKVAVFYHKTMLLHEQHKPLARPEHPAWLHHETPLRISSIYEHLMAGPLADRLTQLDITPTTLVTEDGLVTAWQPVELIHSLKHINKVKNDSEAIGEGENTFDFDDEYY